MNDDRFIAAVVACVAAGGALPPPQRPLLATALALLLADRAPAPSAQDLRRHHENVIRASGGLDLPVALVFGGATKVKDYVFEAPRLPEIRGASALLDWVNTTALRDLWVAELEADFTAAGYPPAEAAALAEAAIVYSSGGNFLALAPAGQRAASLARRVERAYTDWTLAGQSVAVAMDIPLLALRYGRDPLAYWVEQLRADYADPELRPLLDRAYPGEAGQPIDQRFFARKTFGELVAALSTAFYRRRDERAAADPPLPHTFYPLAPWDERCSSSAVRPALFRGRVSEEDETTLTLSAPAARRRYVGQVVKRDAPATGAWYSEHFTWSRPEQLPAGGWEAWARELVSWEQRWRRWLGGEGAASHYARAVSAMSLELDKIYPSHDVHEIGSSSKGYIGLIYADGNRVGQWMRSCKTPGEYASRSEALDRATGDAVFHALGEHLAPARARRKRGMRPVHPFEILTIGGDDLLLIVPGNQALKVALSIAHHFERSASLEPATPQATLSDRYIGDEAGADPPTSAVAISAGVVIARQDTPIFFLRDLVDELLKNAKAHARERARLRDLRDAQRRDEDPAFGPTSGSVDFMALKSVSMVTNKIKEYRARAFGQEQGRPSAATHRLTARPYTWHELGGLIQTVEALRAAGRAGVPRSQLYRIAEVLDATRASGVTAGALEYLYTRSRLRPEHNAAILSKIELAWRGTGQRQGVGTSAPPWLRRAVLSRDGPAREEDAGWETIWADLVEIYDFVTLPAEVEQP